MPNSSVYPSDVITPLELEETPEPWKTWLFGILIITAASFLSPAAILSVPLLPEILYERIMVFLVALGIGAMSGSCIFILIPQAFDIVDVAKIDYVTKCWLMISAVYIFFMVDRILQCVIVYRRRKKARRKVHTSTIDAILGRVRKKSKINEYDNRYHHRYNNNKSTLYSNGIDRNDLKMGETTVPRRKNNDCLSHRHSLIIDEYGNVQIDKSDSDNCYGNGDCNKNHSKRDVETNMAEIDSKFEPQNIAEPGNGPVGKLANWTNPRNHMHHRKYFSHYNNSHFHHQKNHNLHRTKSTSNMDEKVRQIREERNNLEDELEVAMISNALTRTFSTRKNIAILKEKSPDLIEYETPDGIRRMLPNGIEHRKKSITNEKSDRSIDLDVEVHEKIVIDKSKLEVASVAYMIIFGSSANNFVDGMSTGAAFSDSIIRGITIGLAVLSQQFPQELGTLAILAKSGLGVRRALLFNMLPITLSYIGFASGVFLDNVDDNYDSFIFAVSAGMYFYIFLGTLIPEIRQTFQETLRNNVREAVLISLLQFSGISFGICFLYLMN